MTARLDTSLRRIGTGCGAAGTAFWIYTFYYISNLPRGDGSGFQWLAEMPLTFVFLFLCLPALLLPRRMAAISAGLGIAGLIAYAMLWQQLLTQFGGDK